MAGGFDTASPPFAGVVVVERKDADNMADAEGMKAEIRLGRGRRGGAGTALCSVIVGKVVSPAAEGVLSEGMSGRSGFTTIQLTPKRPCAPATPIAVRH